MDVMHSSNKVSIQANKLQRSRSYHFSPSWNDRALTTNLQYAKYISFLIKAMSSLQNEQEILFVFLDSLRKQSNYVRQLLVMSWPNLVNFKKNNMLRNIWKGYLYVHLFILRFRLGWLNMHLIDRGRYTDPSPHVRGLVYNKAADKSQYLILKWPLYINYGNKYSNHNYKVHCPLF